jgi:hypothetical protein
MKIKIGMLLMCSVVTFSFSKVKAQTQTFTPGQLHAAERVIDASGIAENLSKVFSTVIQNKAQLIAEDKRAAFTDAMTRFVQKYITIDEVKKAFIPLYAAELSESELNQIADFLSTPAGKAMTSKQPELMNQAMQWGQKIVIDHKEDLEKMMNDAMGTK